ncbi:hypothetical protein CDV31_003711 [Fusarium ambrosium]|uniref:Serine aminopeptidase S33 domain-containing protein n=1 Tax=Fusarium ambrosium TaxID=131363 RepID=A0A428UT53_9HYPO|nr:hypothetical protein CDV31_003711 [Fusarium ambrosium]
MDSEASESFSTQHHHHQFVLSSGASAHKWQCDSSSPRAILILQHGFGEYAERYVISHSQFIPKLNAARFEVWALDLWGHGTSPGDRGIVDVEMAVKDHLEMRRRADARGLPVFLFGRSLGGLITAASVAENSSYHTNGVILSSPALTEGLPLPAEYLVHLLAYFMPTTQIPTPKASAEDLCGDPEQARLTAEDESKYKGQISFLVASSALQVARRLWARCGQWTQSTLVIHGTSDSHAQFRLSERLVRDIASTDKTLHPVEGGYHELLNEEDPKEIVNLLFDWLESHM